MYTQEVCGIHFHYFLKFAHEIAFGFTSLNSFMTLVLKIKQCICYKFIL